MAMTDEEARSVLELIGRSGFKACEDDSDLFMALITALHNRVKSIERVQESLSFVETGQVADLSGRRGGK